MMTQGVNQRLDRKILMVASLIMVLPLAFAEAKENCATYQLDVEVEICSETKDRAKVGKTIRWTLSVPSTDKPMTLRLRNATPMVAQLRRGCADGIVRTSGGARNEARCKVKVIGLGRARLEAWPHIEDPRQKADFIASMIAGDLARCAREFQTRREILESTTREHSGRKVYSMEDVEALLVQGERCALSALAGLLELVPMADWFDMVFEDARQELQSMGTRAVLPSDEGSRVVLSVLTPESVRPMAVLAHSGERYVEAEQCIRILDMVSRWLGLATGKADEKKLLIPKLSVKRCDKDEKRISLRLRLYPWSYEEASVKEWLDHTFEEQLYIGLYAYELKKKGARKKGCFPPRKNNPCNPLDLMKTSVSVLKCEFDESDESDESLCASTCDGGETDER